MPKSILAIAALSVIALGAMLGCENSASTFVLADSAEATLTKQTENSVLGSDSNIPGDVVHVGLSAAFVSEQGVDVYERLVDYLSGRSGLRCKLVTGLSYNTLNDMLEEGALDIAFVCGLPYVLQQEADRPPTRLLAAPIMSAPQYQDAPKYFSYTVVQKDSQFDSFSSLRGCTYVYNDELSNSGYNLPRGKLIELGETEGFFSKVLRSGSHEESIRMVAEGKADASSVDSLVFDYEMSKHPEFATRLRIVETLGPSGICPVVASIELPEAAFQVLKSVLLDMNEDQEGIDILNAALVDRFVEVADANYEDIKEQLRKARAAGYLEIK